MKDHSDWVHEMTILYGERHAHNFRRAADALDRVAALERELAEARKPTTPRPWPPPEGVSRCLGWDKDNERWRVCIHEYGGWVFEDGLGPVRHWCPVWQPMPPEPEVGL